MVELNNNSCKAFLKGRGLGPPLPSAHFFDDRLAGTSPPNARFYQLQVLSNFAAQGRASFPTRRLIPARKRCDPDELLPSPAGTAGRTLSPQVSLAWWRATVS
ncbi:hypothetical protein [Microcoleus sp. S13_B4]|uniref:hypothetical protein n=1 Tax=Microcoleus sp. S13_B4 TaxID=3055408 RepID=UPI002FD43B7F